jgi:phosphoribosylamine--glycine ligase
MRILLIGSGGREHALGWKLAASPRVDELISLPGNPGLADLGPIVEGIGVTDVGAIAAMARIHAVDLVVVGPEAPLAAGVADALIGLGVPVFGPSRAAARLESSKSYAKEVMGRAGAPTGTSATFTDPLQAQALIATSEGPYVVKADGLAGGKGVLVTETREEASAWVDRWVESGPVVIEEFLEGPEVSVFAVCTENGAVPLQTARDYKRLGDGGTGPNTGGMGAYSPVDDLPDGLVDQVMAKVIAPTLGQMRDEGSPFTGFLYAGMVLTGNGPKVLEFNVRLGDPEAEAILPLMITDLVEVLEGAVPVWSGMAAVDVVLAAPGYPEAPEPGGRIHGVDGLPNDILVFHAGTRRDGNRLLVDGGRVLNVVGLGPTVGDARDRVYQAIEGLGWPGMRYRTDIAKGL